MTDVEKRAKREREINVLVHKGTPDCCRGTLLNFAKHDRYMGGGEPGDRVDCGCGNALVYAPTSRGNYLGWKVRP